MLKKLIGWLIALGAIAGIAYAVVVLTRDDAEGVDEQVIVVDEVGRSDLQDTVIVRGEVNRDDRFSLAAFTPQRVTAVTVAVDDVVAAGDEIVRLDGRPMLAIDGTTPYWRSLQRFVTDGPDVQMLEEFLEAEGYDPGVVNTEFSTNTRDALEAWQADHGYPVDGQFLPTDVAIQSWPATVGDVLVDVGETVSPGQPLAQFVEDELAVSIRVDPTDRSRLDVGLPATITVTANDVEASGVIDELAEAPEVDGQGVERYPGEVRLTSDLDLVEGAAVRVEVVLTEVLDALVVPVASVSLDGSGGEEVRILTADGTLARVPVVTGLTEGALVEIVEGLDGGEQVVVEVRR